MTLRRPALGITVGLGALLVLACSSSEGGRAPIDDGDASGAIGDGGPADAGEDAHRDADAALPPPNYEFEVACAGTPCVKRLAARGGSHACAVLQDGSVRCWGANVSGQLGTGANGAEPMPELEARPRLVSGISSATGVTATGQGLSGTTCVVSSAGDVSCFGSDAWGQLGRGETSSTEPHPDPVVIPGVKAKSITLASTFALAVGTDARVWSWGADDAFQLARAAPQDAGPNGAPARADRISSSVRSFAGTSKNGFVVTESGDVLSWGSASAEQLGRSSSLRADPVPAPIALSDMSSIATGAAHACALSRAGGVHCWGRNDHGQLGTGAKGEELLPARVLLPDEVQAVAVAAGGNNTCIIAANGDIHCWGANDSGQLGVAGEQDYARPLRIEGLAEQVVSVAIMDEAICALLRNGSVACWGDNLVGQLGRGSRDREIHVTPAPIVLE